MFTIFSNSARTFLNDIILKIHTIEDIDEMRCHLLSNLRYLVPSSGSVFYLVDNPDICNFSAPICMGITNDEINLYLNEYQDYDHTRWIYDTPSGKVYNDSAFILSEMTSNSDFYQRIHGRLGTRYQVTLRIVHNGTFVGLIGLFRTEEQGDFSQDECFNLELIGPHLGYRLYDHLITNFTKSSVSRQLYLLFREKYTLTDREAEIGALIIDDVDKEEVCELLCISPNTLKKHVTSIYKKLSVRNRIEFVKEVQLAMKSNK